MQPAERPRPWTVHLPTGVDASALDLGGADGLSRRWVDLWAADPHRLVITGVDGTGLTAGELEESSARRAGRLAGQGLAPGDRLLLSAESSLDLVVTYVAALRLGLTVVPVNAAYRQQEIAHIVRDARPRAAVMDSAERGGWVEEASDESVLVTDPAVDLPDGGVECLDESGPEDVALLCYTSGTTGASKGAALRHRNLLASAQALALAWRWTEEDRLVLALPLFHIHGLGVGLHGTLVTGASAVLLPKFDVDAVLDASSRHQATLFFGVPTMYARLAASDRASELGRLRLCVSGSAPLPASLFTAIEARGGQRVLERYGMTETIMNVSNPYDGERRPGTVGFPLPGVELRLAGETNEIELRGPNVFSGYWRNDTATAASFTEDGWFRTGDVGSIDGDGYLRIESRLKEMIITGGLNVYPREIEDVLLEHPDVAEVAVVGQPSDEWGEIVSAFVVPVSGESQVAELHDFTREQLAPYKCPRSIHIVDSLPRNALGKVLKNQLRAP